MTGPTPAPTISVRICPNCDGFAFAAISSGGRDAHGHLHTLTVDCPVCDGHGTVLAPAVQLTGGRA